MTEVLRKEWAEGKRTRGYRTQRGEGAAKRVEGHEKKSLEKGTEGLEKEIWKEKAESDHNLRGYPYKTEISVGQVEEGILVVELPFLLLLSFYGRRTCC